MLENPRDPGRVSRSAFDLVHRRNLVYNQCWEDPALDRLALRPRRRRPRPRDHERGLQRPRLRPSGRRGPGRGRQPAPEPPPGAEAGGDPALDFEAFFSCSGAAVAPTPPRSTGRCVPSCRPARASFWDREIRLFEPERARGGSFYFARHLGPGGPRLRWYVDPTWRRIRGVVDRILAADQHPEQQLALLARAARAPARGRRLRVVGSPAVLSLLGVPEPAATAWSTAIRGDSRASSAAVSTTSCRWRFCATTTSGACT